MRLHADRLCYGRNLNPLTLHCRKRMPSLLLTRTAPSFSHSVPSHIPTTHAQQHRPDVCISGAAHRRRPYRNTPFAFPPLYLSHQSPSIFHSSIPPSLVCSSSTPRAALDIRPARSDTLPPVPRAEGPPASCALHTDRSPFCPTFPVHVGCAVASPARARFATFHPASFAPPPLPHSAGALLASSIDRESHHRNASPMPERLVPAAGSPTRQRIAVRALMPSRACIPSFSHISQAPSAPPVRPGRGRYSVRLNALVPRMPPRAEAPSRALTFTLTLEICVCRRTGNPWSARCV